MANMLITPEYRELNAKLHDRNPGYGAGYASSTWYPHISQFAKLLNASSILDYGCGKGQLGKSLSAWVVKGYDPAIPGRDDAPEPADLVVCTDVLEHIEPECLDAVMDDLKRLTIKGIFLTVALHPASKFLEDGRNAHLIQQKSEWWLPKIQARWDMRFFQAQVKDFVVFGLPLAVDFVKPNMKAVAA